MPNAPSKLLDNIVEMLKEIKTKEHEKNTVKYEQKDNKDDN